MSLLLAVGWKMSTDGNAVWLGSKGSYGSYYFFSALTLLVGCQEEHLARKNPVSYTHLTLPTNREV